VSKKLFFKKEVLDPETGEYLEFIAFIPQPKDKNFTKVFRLFGDKVVEDLANGILTGGEAKLLLWFLAETTKLPVQSAGWIPVKYEELAKTTSLGVDTVRKYIKKLVEKGYLEQFQKGQKVFRLKPNYVYRGILAKLKEAEPDF